MSTATASQRLTPEQYLRDWEIHDQPLTTREREIAKLLMRGYATREMASKLKIGEGTIHVYKAAIFDKMDVHSAAELTAVLWLGFAKDYALVSRIGVE